MSTQPDGPNSPLADELCEEIGKHLQLTLVELIALSLAGKQLHWNAYGRDFLAIHRHLDDVVDEWHELGDAVAERAVALGIPADGSAAAVLELGNLRPSNPDSSKLDPRSSGCARSSGKWPSGSGSAANCLPTWTASLKTSWSMSAESSKSSCGLCGRSSATSGSARNV